MGKLSITDVIEDTYGFSTLDTIASADKFNRWMYSVISPFCKGEILEIGGGIGNISIQCLLDGKYLTVTELKDEYCSILRHKLSSEPGLRQVLTLDIVDPDFDKKFNHLYHRFDTVFALNVIEHIQNRGLALENCRKLLKPGGRIIILVPAFGFLFNQFDDSLGHYLRFTRKTLNLLMRERGFEIQHTRYFNFMGILGWWFSGSILKKKNIPEGQMKLYNQLVPVFRIIDAFTQRFAGLSVVSVGTKLMP
jgi:SAM-dependent methyltransferase